MMLIYCSNKKCNKQMEPLLDVADNTVYCSECGEACNNVTEFAKKSMASIGQIKRVASNPSEGFSVQCPHCSKSAKPSVKGDKAFCTFCKKENTNLNKFFIRSIKESKV